MKQTTKPLTVKRLSGQTACSKTAQQQKTGTKATLKQSRLLSSETEQPVKPSSADASSERGKHREHGFQHQHKRDHQADHKGNNALTVSFKLEAKSWVKTLINPRGKTRSQTFADPDGDGSFTPVRRDPLTGTSKPATSSQAKDVPKTPGRPEHHRIQPCTLTFDGTTLVETDRHRFGSMVSTFADADKDGTFTAVSRVFQPSATAGHALAGRLDTAAGTIC